MRLKFLLFVISLVVVPGPLSAEAEQSNFASCVASEENSTKLVGSEDVMSQTLISERNGTVVCFELANKQYFRHEERRQQPGAPERLFAVGPRDMVTTWSSWYLPFSTDVNTKIPLTVKRTIRTSSDESFGTEVEGDFDKLYERDPVYTRISAPEAEVAVYVWPDPGKDRSDLYVERRIWTIDHYRLGLSVIFHNFGVKSVELEPSLWVHAWEDPEGNSSRGLFSPQPDILEGLCMTADDLTRENRTDLLEDPGAGTAVGRANWVAVGGRYFVVAAVNDDEKNAGCDLSGKPYGVVSARMYSRNRLELPGGACRPEWYKGESAGSPRCGDVMSVIGLEEDADLDAVALALQNNNDRLDAGQLKHIDVYLKSRGSSQNYQLYLGPKDIDELKKADAQLEDALDFWIVGVISKPMLGLLKWFHSVIPNWTLAIVLLTILVKLVLLPLTQKSFGQMQRMAALKPQMEEIKKKYGKDKTRMNQETMSLYKREKVKPLGGCLPMLLQMPIWIALYRTILSSVELFQAPMGLWISDLSAPDPFFVLPLLLGGLMFAQQKLTPTSADASQAKMMMYFMPVMFTVFMLFLPSGLNLYILVNTLLSLFQQMYLKKKFAQPAMKRA